MHARTVEVRWPAVYGRQPWLPHPLFSGDERGVVAGWAAHVVDGSHGRLYRPARGGCRHAVGPGLGRVLRRIVESTGRARDTGSCAAHRPGLVVAARPDGPP